MAIQIGQQLGPYEITSPLGEGGMGIVYRARDNRLERDVAIKALPDAFADDSDRLQRFQREAQVLASLNHPNIAHIYGLEESGKTRCIVMELVEGETLQERLKRGPIPIDEVLPIARQIAEAVEAAHEKGIIHRDLKPGNIKVAPDGKVKVLDFGLAKAFQEQAPATLSHSPTLLSGSIPGLVLGTAAYMSPEQARGRNVDRTTDVWAFGCVLYEMLTGRPAFDGEDVTEIIGRIVTTEPDWNRLPAAIPGALERLLRRALRKDPRQRLGDIRDARIEIEDAIAGSPAEKSQAAVPTAILPANNTRDWIWKAIAGVSLLALGAVILSWAPWRSAPPAAPLWLNSELGADVGLANVGGNSAIALSPDGSMLAFVGVKNGATQIYIRRLGQLQAAPLAGTSGAQSPFFSPEGQWLGFFAEGKLKKISVTGGAAVTLADAPNQRGGSWGDDGNIVFTPDSSVGTSLQRVSSAGGDIEPLSKLAQGETTHRWPLVLPGARDVLYISSALTGNYENSNIMVQPLPSGTPKVLVRGGYHPQYVASGHLLYIHDGTLFAAPFDLNRLEVTGPSAPAVEGVSAQSASGSAQFAVSRTGVFTYVPGKGAGNENPVLWMTPDGKTAPLRAMAAAWGNPHFSPDGQRLAMDIVSGNGDVWIYEWARDTLARFTFDPSEDRNPVWTPDGKRIAFASTRTMGSLNLYWQRADGTGEIQRLTESSNAQYPASFHPSGKYLAFTEATPNSGNHLMILPIEGDETSGWKPSKPSAFLSTPPAGEFEPMFSPDGRWIAYASNESGRGEVFVRPFPGPGGKWQISTGGGLEPAWSRNRRELLYRGLDNRIMVASYTVDGESFKADKPRLWSEQAIVEPVRNFRSFDLHPDGERVAVAVPPAKPGEKLDHVTFIFNFFDELRRIAPPSKK